MIRIVGVDLSLTATGLAAVMLPGRTTWTKLIGKDGVTRLPLAERITEMDRLNHLLVQQITTADLVVIEGLDSARRYGAVNERAYLWYRLVSRMVKAEAAVVEVQSQRLKIYATGSGSTKKAQVLQAVAGWGLFDLTGPNGRPDDNLADAATLVAIGADLVGQPLVRLPDEHRRFFKLLQIPESVHHLASKGPTS